MSENKEREAFEAWLATSAQDISDADWTTQGIWLGGYRAALQAGGQPVAWHIGNADGSMSKLGAIYHDRKSAVRHIDSYGGELEACIVPLYAAPAPVGEPADLLEAQHNGAKVGEQVGYARGYADGVKADRQGVALSDEAIILAWVNKMGLGGLNEDQLATMESFCAFARALLAAKPAAYAIKRTSRMSDSAAYEPERMNDGN